jgi:puromycin-sensitive aminopeptidase
VHLIKSVFLLLFCWYWYPLFCKYLLFQKALASYIKKYAYSNAKTEDLWAVLEEESGEPVKDLMTAWTKQQGYPVIYAKLNGHELELEQVC